MIKNFLLPLMMAALMFTFVACGDDKDEAPLPEESIEDIIDSVEASPDVIDTVVQTPTPETPKKDGDKTPATPTDATKKPLEGYVASLDGLVQGGNGRVSKADASAIVGRGGILVFKSGNTVYFVYNEDGSFASKRLASFASADKVGILGKSQSKGGINIFIMTMIDAI
ncbi:MAG: hypothetical protein CVV22_12640 [Ignavibacteriae bacterium HGW-Ignavibacteriae-1]|jgi:hypothetical protein|nr:MAG: hypothetical protein CVV22_12640 [Ignavibacteriae bacterium HGW-Ignavibacteriae-1]